MTNSVKNISAGKAILGLVISFALIYATAYVAGKGWKNA